MAYNIGPKIGIDGEAEFRRQIADINRSYKTLEAQTKAAAAAFALHGDEQQALTEQSEILQKKLAQQRDKVKLLEDALDKARKQYASSVDAAEKYRAALAAADASTPAEEIQKYRQELNRAEATARKTASGIISMEGALYDSRAAVSGLEKELKDTDRRMEELAQGLDEVADEADDAGDAVGGLGTILGANLAADAIWDGVKEGAEALAELGEKCIESAADVQAAESQFSQSFGELEDVARRTLDGVAEHTGITGTRMQESFTMINAFAKTAGMESEEALDIASRALVAAADSAAYYDKTVEDATETLQSFLKGNYENDAALGISATETTRNAKANELYAKSFQELSEAQKVDVLLSMVEAGNAASGALGQAAREADSWTNVTGELDEAIRQLEARLGDPILQGVASLIQAITGEVQKLATETAGGKLSSGIREFTTAMEESEQTLEKTRAQIDSNAYIAGRYVERLEELEDAGLDTADAQREYASTVELLNELMPELNVTIDEHTGLIDADTGALMANIEAIKRRATEQALLDKYNAQIQARAEVEAELIAVQTRQQQLEAEKADLIRRGAVEQERYTQAIVATADGLGYMQIPLAGLDKELADNRLEYIAGQHAIAAYDAELARLDAELVEAESHVRAYNDANAGVAAGATTVAEGAQAIQEKLDAVAAAYETAKENARTSIDSQIGLFEELQTKCEMTASEIVKNWEKQQAAFLSYSENLKKAIEMGLDERLVRQFSNGSQTSMLYLNELVNSSKVSVEDINAAFGGMSEAKATAEGVMGDIESGFSETLDRMVADAEASGLYVIDGLIVSIQENTYRLENAMRDMAKKAHAAFNRTMEINSPSRVMVESGEWTVEGAVVAVEARTADLEKAMANLALAGNAAYLEQQLAAASTFPERFESVAPVSSSTVHHNFGDIHVTIYQQPGEDGADLAGRFAAEMQHELEKRMVSIGG